MDKRESMWDVYLKKGMSRRSFIKGCVALTSVMGLSTDMLSKVVEAAEAKPLPVVIWLHGHECTGCDESFIRSGAPLASDLVLNNIALEYDHLLSAACGEPFEAHLEETIEKYKGQYILAVEGAVATKDNGIYCMSGGRPFIQTLQRVAKGAAAIIAYGSCAVAGGIQAAKPNPTGSAGIAHFTGNKQVINVPGCPPIPEVMTGVVMHIALFGKLPPLDAEDRPKQFYGNRIHDTALMMLARKQAGVFISWAAVARRRIIPAAICAGIRACLIRFSRVRHALAAVMRISGMIRRLRSDWRSMVRWAISIKSVPGLPLQQLLV